MASSIEQLLVALRNWARPEDQMQLPEDDAPQATDPAALNARFQAARMYNRGFNPSQGDDLEALAEQYGLAAGRAANAPASPPPAAVQEVPGNEGGEGYWAALVRALQQFRPRIRVEPGTQALAEDQTQR